MPNTCATKQNFGGNQTSLKARQPVPPGGGNPK
jgi:hypothetical protein